MSVDVHQADGIGQLILDRPSKAHAYDRAHLEALHAGIEALGGAIHVVVVRSTGDRAFCGGADLNAMAGADPLDALDLYSQRVFTALARAPFISIASVQGAAVAGGCELALACDLRVVGPQARFLLPETKLGIIPSAGGCTRLTRLVGPAVAKRVILAGATLDAVQAVAMGLADGPHEDPLGAALALAAQVAQHDPVALRLAKQIIDQGESDASLEAERVAESLLYARKADRPA